MLVYKVSRIVPHPPEHLFGLVADVERYPEFLDGWESARIHRREPNAYKTVQTVRVGPLKIRFDSTTTLEPPLRISVRSHDWPFRELLLVWQFQAIEKDRSRVDLEARVECQAPLLEPVLHLSLPGFLEETVSRFQNRADQLHGQ